MPIYIGSRYEYDAVYSLTCPRNGNHNHSTVFSNKANSNRASEDLAFRYYVIVDGDRLDSIAYRAYGDASRWWYIADANPDVAYDPNNLTPGQLLRIPRASG